MGGPRPRAERRKGKEHETLIGLLSISYFIVILCKKVGHMFSFSFCLS